MDWVTFAQQIFNGVVNGVGYVLFALGLTLLFGVLGVINIAHGGLFMLAGMLFYSFIAYLAMNPFLALILSIAAMALIGLLVNRVAVQPLIGRDPLAVLLSTFGVSFVILHIALAVWGSYPLPQTTFFPAEPLRVGGLVFAYARITLLVAGILVIAVFYLVFTKSKMGKYMRAISQNLIGAKVIGIRVNYVYAFTFVIASVLAGIGAILLSLSTLIHAYIGEHMLILGFVVVIVGGLGSVIGCVITGLTIGVFVALFGGYIDPNYAFPAVYGVMVIVLLVKPEGLFSRSRIGER